MIFSFFFIINFKFKIIMTYYTFENINKFLRNSGLSLI